MKNIFVLTKREQRVVIVIVMALLAATIAKHYRDAQSQVPPRTSTSPETTPFPTHPAQEQTAPDDQL